MTLESLVHPFLSRVSSKTPSEYFFSYVLNFQNLYIFVKYHGEEGNIEYSSIFSSRFLSNQRTFDLLPKGRPEKKDGGECFAFFLSSAFSKRPGLPPWSCHGKGGRHWGCPRACHQEAGILREWIYALCLTLESLVHPFLSRLCSKSASHLLRFPL